MVLANQGKGDGINARVFNRRGFFLCLIFCPAIYDFRPLGFKSSETGRGGISVGGNPDDGRPCIPVFSCVVLLLSP